MQTGINKYKRQIYSFFCSLFNYSALRTCSYDIDLVLTSVSVERNSVWLDNGTCESLTGWVQITNYLYHRLVFLS